MHTRGAIAIAALLLVGTIGGYAVAAALADDGATGRAAQPIAATDPSIPSDPEIPPRNDRNEPAMAPGQPLVSAALDSGRGSITFPVPAGWTKAQPYANELKFKPKGNPAFTYVLRIEQVGSQRQTIEDLVRMKSQTAEAGDPERDLEFVKQLRYTYDTYEHTYTYEGYLRHSIVTWLDVSGSGQAEVEIELNGRDRDVPGMLWLMDQIVNRIQLE